MIFFENNRSGGRLFMKKTLAVALTIALAFSMFSSFAMINVEAAVNNRWDTSKYGDTIDIGTKIRHFEKDEEYVHKLDKKIREMASQIDFSLAREILEDKNDGNFTYNGGTKKFLGYDLSGYYFKDFTLRSLGENVEIWVAKDLSFPDHRPAHIITQEQVDKLRDEFDNNIYMIDTEFFGIPDSHTGEGSQLVEWGYVPQGYYEPLDGKERVIMLVDNIRDQNYYDENYPFFVAGFYSPTYESYFDRNIINIDTRDWDSRLEKTFFATTAHELQHLIHDDNDSNEELWINEGMSSFAEYLCGYGHPWGHINFFLDHPENSLVEWDDHYDAETGPETLADYGQAYLLQLYMYDHFGKDFIQKLAKDKDQGFTSINKMLRKHGEDIDFEELFRRFSIAVAIDSPRVIFDNSWFKSRRFPKDLDSTRDYESLWAELDKLWPKDAIYNFDSIDIGVSYESAQQYDKDGVPAWGGDYKILEDASRILRIKFDGIEFMPIPWKVVDDPTGIEDKVLWGNKGDEADNQIIIKADLSKVDSATLKFDNYFNIEEQWDFGVVQVSTDDGHTWTSLENENTRFDIMDNGYPKIKENLPGFTGYYQDWNKEEFDLTPYAGQKILINFRYMADWATNETGWYIDNIEIPEIGLNNDCSSTDGFYSINEILETKVEYAVTFINKLPLGRKDIYRVRSIEPFSVSEEDTKELRNFFRAGESYMIVWYAAPQGEKGTVDYSYEIIYWDQLKNRIKKEN